MKQEEKLYSLEGTILVGEKEGRGSAAGGCLAVFTSFKVVS